MRCNVRGKDICNHNNGVKKGSTAYRMVEYHFSIPVLLKTQVSDWTANHPPRSLCICYLLSHNFSFGWFQCLSDDLPAVPHDHGFPGFLTLTFPILRPT